MADYRRPTYNRQTCCPPPPPPPVQPEAQEPHKAPLSLAMSYVPLQNWKETFDPERALAMGTIFPELHMPFLGIRKGGCCK